MGKKARNHFIPKFLQRHFASRIDGKKVFIWRYSANTKPEELSTTDVGVGKYFYGQEEESLEDKFMALEGTHASILRDLAAGSFDFAVRSGALADMVWLLAMRTEANRTTLAATFDTLMDELGKQSHSDRAKKALLDHADANIDRQFREMLATLPEGQQKEFLQPAKLAELEKVKANFREAVISGGVASFAASTLDQVREEARKTSGIKKSHNSALTKLIDGGAKCPAMRVPDSWTLMNVADGPFVLGDACVFTRDRNGAIGNFIGSDEPYQVYFSMSPTITLVGHFGEQQDMLEPEDVARTAISISCRYVCANRTSQAIQDLVDQTLGSHSYGRNSEKIAEIAASAWERLGE